ncbi:MAG: polyphosphate kinase 1 [Anaerolineales bacterium]|nr:MAG: polyphosphate kinase 1 [Anaerolineales bacterium]
MPPADAAVKEEKVEKVEKAEEAKQVKKGQEIEEAQVDLNDPDLFLNRELSLLDFQARVLEEALDEDNPLLERAKFMAFVGNNLDEFFMVRVAGLKKQIAAGVVDVPPDGMTPAEQLAAIRKVTLRLMTESQNSFQKDLVPALDKVGVHILNYDDLTQKQKENTDSYFTEVIFPILTPMAFDPGHPFPHISNLSLNLAVLVRDSRDHFARIKVPSTLPRLVPIKRSSGSVRKDGTVPHHHYFVWLEQVIAANLHVLFPGMEVIESHPFRVTRDADLIIQELEASDLLESIEQGVRLRRFGSVVRITVNKAMPTHIRNILIENLEMDRNDMYTLEGPLGLSSLMSLYQVDRFDLKDHSFVPSIPAPLGGESYDGNIFAAIRQGNILVHHPYDSFIPVVDFLQLAAKDPNVYAIKQTLYRTGSNSPVIKALLDARETGKQVAVLVELKARFDEESNIGWARTMERQGVHVIYGLLGLKTHSKIALVVRKEGEHIRRYVHLATGNYNAVTALSYEDIGMFTCDDEIGADATDLFNYLTGYSTKQDYRKLLVAPVNLRERMTALIEREIEHQRNGEQGHLIFKMNSLVDKRMIKKLYEASMAGVKIDLIVRGMCCLRPGIEGVSDNIRVLSVVGRFLEHSRIYYFRNGGQEEILLGSADLMPRNINNRVEVLFPVEDSKMIRYLRDDVLAEYQNDNVKARVMSPDGTYKRIERNGDAPPFNIQVKLFDIRQTNKENT